MNTMRNRKAKTNDFDKYNTASCVIPLAVKRGELTPFRKALSKTLQRLEQRVNAKVKFTPAH